MNRAKAALEDLRVASRGQPEIERCVDEQAKLVIVEDLARDRDRALAGHERFRGERLGVVRGDEVSDLLTEGFARFHR